MCGTWRAWAGVRLRRYSVSTCSRRVQRVSVRAMSTFSFLTSALGHRNRAEWAGLTGAVHPEPLEPVHSFFPS